MERKPFVLENPIGEPGHMFAQLTIDLAFLDFVRSRPYVDFVHDFSYTNKAHVHFDPRYDYEEAWLTLHYELEKMFEDNVKLDDIWEDALND